jgi:DNA-binding LacI/PurR family transcriptional regulator
MSTIEQIAKQLGISTASVSRALNNKPGVSEEKRRQVQELAASLNYAPSIAARSLATSTTHTIGFLSVDRPLPLSTDPFYLHVLRGAEQELSRRGYFLIVSTVDMLQDARELLLLREKRVDGLILAGPFFPEHFIHSLKTAEIPLVLVDNAISQPPVDCILVEDEGTGFEATHHLLKHGNCEVATISGPSNWPSSRLRGAGYRRAMQDAGLASAIYCEADTTQETGYQAMLKILNQHPSVQAVFAVNDLMAMGAIRAILESGRNVPQDVAVIGVDDVDLAAHTIPPLTTMHVPTRYLGIMAVRRLVQLLRNKEEPIVISMVTTELVIRSTCGCK